jgi:iron-sulfur cluster assembly accessory protein
VNDTRPPAITEQHSAVELGKPEQADISVTEKEAQKTKPIVAGTEASKSTQDAKPRRKLRARKAAMSLTPGAVKQLQALLNQPSPKLIKVGVKNRGCSGLAYSLEYVDKAGAFDETVEQDGVKVLVDSKALFSIIGSEMDWVEDKLNQRFVFNNPNISKSLSIAPPHSDAANNLTEEQCGCGESFMV